MRTSGSSQQYVSRHVAKLALLLASVAFSSCSMYPLGNMRGAKYFGGHGNADGLRPSEYVSPSIQRNNAMTFHP